MSMVRWVKIVPRACSEATRKERAFSVNLAEEQLSTGAHILVTPSSARNFSMTCDPDKLTGSKVSPGRRS